jgi:competence protein ComFC
MWMIISFLSKIADIIFPKSCYGCGKENFKICDKCLKRCTKAVETPSLYITSIYSFKDPLIKQIIHEIKYYHHSDLIETLVKEVANEFQKTIDYELSAINWVLIPIPMPRLRKYIRGYNQSEIIAKKLGEKLSLPVNSNLLIRSYSPKRQVSTKTRNERIKNQYNTFRVNNNVKDLNIILVDDVTTTGATLNEARRVLLKAGAKSIRAITIAH